MSVRSAPQFLFHLEAFEIVKAKGICNATTLLMSIMVSGGVGLLRWGSHHLKQSWPDKAYCTSCRSDQIYLEEKVGGGGV